MLNVSMRSAVIMIVIRLNIIIQNVDTISVKILSVIKLNVVIQLVVTLCRVTQFRVTENVSFLSSLSFSVSYRGPGTLK
jgi:hypothetical protein